MRNDINHDRRRFLSAAALTMAGARLGFAGSVNAPWSPMNPAEIVHLATRDELHSLGRATGWLNSPPLTADGLRGKVVLIDFWTYTCINWIRQLPYVRAWDEKYRDRGLVVIGVHSPEFAFERNLDNVRRAAKDMSVTYPIAIDNEFSIWRAFNNHYWPALYFVDAKGDVRDHHFGEGDYARSERRIQRLLGA